MTQLGLDPALTQKRLGDGFYEQQLLREQVAQLTGRRFLSGYASDEAEYQALMTAGATFAQSHQLIPGVALTEAQMAQLTSDIVWLVEKSVTLADGSTQQVLVPQLYVRPQAGDLDGSGTLLAGDSVHLNLSGDLTNRNATIAGRTVVALTAENIRNLGGRITGNSTDLAARTDLANIGGRLEGGDRLSVAAGRDLTVETTTATADNVTANARFSRTTVDRVAGLYVSNPNGILVASAGNDLQLIAAEVANSGEHGQTTLGAGRDLTLGTVTESALNQADYGRGNAGRISATQERGSTLSTQGNLTLLANRDLTVRAANVASEQGAITAAAGNNLTIEAGLATRNEEATHSKKSSGFLSSSKKSSHDTLKETTAIGSTFSGDSVSLQADQDLTVTGSNVVGTHDVALAAGNNVSIEAATETHDETHLSQKSKSGVFASGNSITLGSQKLKTTNDSQAVTHLGSTIGSTDGNVSITAGNPSSGSGQGLYTQTGSNVLAPNGDIDITAQKVDIKAAIDTAANQQSMQFKQSGLSVSISNPVINAVQTASQMKDAASQTSDPRMQALAAATTALSAKNAYDVVAKDPANAGGINVSVSLGSSKSSSQSSQNSTTAVGSTVAAGNNVNITATGDGKDSDLNVTGSKISAGNNATLTADDQINLLAAQNTSSQQSSNKSSSASVGFSVGTNGFAVTASASKGKGNSNGSDVTYTDTQVTSGNTLMLASGGDTNLKGATAAGKQVIADIGGNLNIESLQDTSTYQAKQNSVGFSVSAGPGNYGGSISTSKTRINSDYASVAEQSGIKAGDNGFQVNVAGNTDLKGAVIASTQTAIDNHQNSLSSQTLTTSDLQNKAEYQGKSSSFTAGVGRNTGADGNIRNTPSASAGYASDSGQASSITQSGVSAGSIAITDNAKQTALTGKDAATTVATLNRDVKVNANGETVDSQGNSTAHTITPIFDQQKVTRELNAAVTITQAFSQVAPKAVADYAQSQYDKLKNTDPAEAAKWAEGGVYRIALHTALGGLITGDISGALGAGAVASAAPLLNDLQKAVQQQLETTGLSAATANTVSQALAELTALGVGSAVGGTAGAATTLVVDTNNRQLHWDGFLKEKGKCDKSPSSQGCGTIEKMAGVGTRVISESITGITDHMVIGNVDAQGNIVSYTIADKNGSPQFIMQPLEFQVYQNATPGIRAMMYTAPQWALDYASALIYNSTGQTAIAADHAGLMLTNPSMWLENAVGLLGGVLAGSEIRGAQTVGSNGGGMALGELTGSPTRIPTAADASEIRSLTRENQSAEILANSGFKVEQNPTIAGLKNPDYRINGEVFDNYAPTSSNVRNISSNIEEKVVSGQTNNVVVNLADSSVTPAALQTQLMKYPVTGLKQVIIIDKSGSFTIVKF